MNANELACEVPVVELLEAVPKDARFVQEEDFSSTYHPVGRLCHEAATMLRQQQSEIAELKHMNRNWQISENILLLELEKLQHCELTDEEIEEIGKQYLSAHAQFIGAGECHYEGEIDFARAILRKAQEK